MNNDSSNIDITIPILQLQVLRIKGISRSLNYFAYVTVENLRRRNMF